MHEPIFAAIDFEVDVEARTQLNVLRPDEVVVSLGATQQTDQ